MLFKNNIQCVSINNLSKIEDIGKKECIYLTLSHTE